MAPWPAASPQVMRHDNSSILELDGKEVSVFTPSKPREKWQRKRTHVKLRVRGPPTSAVLLNPHKTPYYRRGDQVTESHAVLLNPRSVRLELLPR